MTAATRFTRTSEEVAGWRAQAAWELDNWGPRSEYVMTTRRAVVDVLDWVAGACAVAPASGREVVADDDTVGEELRRALTLEELARQGAVDGDPVRYGRIALALAWVCGDPGTESPL